MCFVRQNGSKGVVLLHSSCKYQPRNPKLWYFLECYDVSRLWGIPPYQYVLAGLAFLG